MGHRELFCRILLMHVIESAIYIVLQYVDVAKYHFNLLILYFIFQYNLVCVFLIILAIYEILVYRRYKKNGKRNSTNQKLTADLLCCSMLSCVSLLLSDPLSLSPRSLLRLIFALSL